MSLTHALHVMDSLSPEDIDFAHYLLRTVTREGQVIFTNVTAFDTCLKSVFGFALVDKNQKEVLPDSWHLFYVRGSLLLRVKSKGTRFRKRAHMTLSAASGLRWDEEVSKFSRESLLPKVGVTGRLAAANDWRTMSQFWDRLGAIDDTWANSCHFDFVQPFDGSAAGSLPLST